VLVDRGTFEYEDEVIPTRTLLLVNGEYVRYWLWSSPARLVELDEELDPQVGDFVYVRVDPKKPKRDKRGESHTPCFMRVIPKSEVVAAAEEAEASAAVDSADDDDPQY
jgi:hypothetical protein